MFTLDGMMLWPRCQRSLHHPRSRDGSDEPLPWLLLLVAFLCQSVTLSVEWSASPSLLPSFSYYLFLASARSPFLLHLPHFFPLSLSFSPPDEPTLLSDGNSRLPCSLFPLSLSLSFSSCFYRIIAVKRINIYNTGPSHEIFGNVSFMIATLII